MEKAFYTGEIVTTPFVFFYGAIYDKDDSLVRAQSINATEQRIKVRIRCTWLRRAKIYIAQTEEHGYVGHVLTHLVQNDLFRNEFATLITPLGRYTKHSYQYWLRDDLLNSVFFQKNTHSRYDNKNEHWIEHYNSWDYADVEPEETYQQHYFIHLDKWENVVKLKEIADSEEPWQFITEFKRYDK